MPRVRRAAPQLGRRHRPHAPPRGGARGRRARLPPPARRPREPRVGAGPRRPLPVQRQRVPRGHARRDEGALRALQRELPLRRGGAALPVRQRGREGGDLPRQLRADAREHLRERLPQIRLWLQVEDGSGEKLEGALDYEAALAAAAPRRPQGLSDDDLYILYTGGTTGMPKGVLWRQDDILRATLLPPRTEPTIPAIVERARRGAGKVRAMPLPPFMHGAAHWAAFTMWHTGGTVVVPRKPAPARPGTTCGPPSSASASAR